MRRPASRAAARCPLPLQVNAAEISHGEARGYQSGYQEDPIFQQVSKLEFERDYHGLVVPDEVHTPPQTQPVDLSAAHTFAQAPL